jgi:hypothetical protein
VSCLPVKVSNKHRMHCDVPGTIQPASLRLFLPCNDTYLPHGVPVIQLQSITSPVLEQSVNGSQISADETIEER